MVRLLIAAMLLCAWTGMAQEPNCVVAKLDPKVKICSSGSARVAVQVTLAQQAARDAKMVEDWKLESEQRELARAAQREADREAFQRAIIQKATEPPPVAVIPQPLLVTICTAARPCTGPTTGLENLNKPPCKWVKLPNGTEACR